jgi:putative transposase
LCLVGPLIFRPHGGRVSGIIDPSRGKEEAVKRKRFNVEQIVAVLKQVEMGAPVADLIRHLGIAEQTLYRWKRPYVGLESEQVREFKQLQDENVKLKRLVADLSLDKVMLQDVFAKKFGGLRGSGSWSPICRPPITSVNGVPAGPFAARGPRIGIGVIEIRARRSRSRSPSWPGHVCGTATARFGCSSIEKAGP